MAAGAVAPESGAIGAAGHDRSWGTALDIVGTIGNHVTMHRRMGALGLGCCLASTMLHCSLFVDLDGMAGEEGPPSSPSGPDSSSSDVVEPVEPIDAAADVVDSSKVDSGEDAPNTLVSFGPPVVLASNLVQPSLLVADEDAVYWIEGNATDLVTTLYRRSAMGEDSPSVIVENVRKPRAMALSASLVFFVSANSGYSGYTSVYSVPKTGGGAPHSIVVNAWGDTKIPALAVEGTGVAYVEYRNANVPAVVRTSASGSGSFDVATSQHGASAVVLRAPYVYWSVTNGILRSNGQAPSEPELFADQAAGTTELAADTTSLYWATADGKLHALGFDKPGATTTVLDTGLKSARGMSVDAHYVYFADTATGEVVAIPRSGGDRLVLATGQEPYATAVNSKALFFVDRASGALVRVPKL